MTELNPNHPVTKAAREQWHKLLTLVMLKQGLTHVVITRQDIHCLEEKTEGVNITVRELEDGIHLQLVDDATARQLVADHLAEEITASSEQPPLS
jgi:hypothetical protein